MLITSVNNSKIKELVRLKEKKYRDNNNLFFIEGKDMVDEAYKKMLIKELYVLEGTEVTMDIPFTYVSYDVMKKISNMESISEYYAVCYKKKELDIGNKIIILDNIQDPGNLGTIIRSAVAFNFDTVVISKDTVDLYNPKVVRSTKGMMFHINIITRDIIPFIEELKSIDYKIIGTKVTNGKDVRETSVYSHFALVIGNEGRGISGEVDNLCDEYLYIKMNENCESLNASVAASILLYEINNK